MTSGMLLSSFMGMFFTASFIVAPPSMLKGKTLEEIVNRWSSDLQACVSEFGKFAAEVALWDRALVENGNNVCHFEWVFLITFSRPGVALCTVQPYHKCRVPTGYYRSVPVSH